VNPPDSDSHPGGVLASRVLVVLASLALVLALVAAYARQTTVDSDQFANRATAALRDDSVRSLIAQKVTDDVVLKNKADLIAARPLIESVASGIVGGRAFTTLFRKAVRDVHAALFKRDQNTVTLTLRDVGTVLAAALQQVRPQLAQQVGSTERVELVNSNIGSLSATLADIAERVQLLALFLLLLSLVLVAGALALAPDKRQVVVQLGVGAAVAGVLLVLAYSVTRSLAVEHVKGPDEQAAARAVFDAFLGDLRTSAWILAASGAVVAAAAASLIKPRPFGEPLRVALEWLATEPQRPALRVLRGVILVAAGVAVLVDRDAVLSLLLTALGIFLVYEGVSAVLRLVYRPEDHEAEEEHEPRVARSARRRRIATALVPVALIVVVVASFLGSGGTTTAAPAKGPCNGRMELCARSFDRVALPTTHNSMSVPLPGWYSSMQERPIADQLSDGIRGLQIDTHYGDRLPNGKVRTVLGSSEDLSKQVGRDGVSEETVAAAERIRDRLGFEGEGERGMYLCHSFCELGATPLASVLDDLHTFLVANPGAVVVVINQDYVAPDDFVGAVRDADLEPFVYKGPVAGDWPTLREMVDSNERVLFLAENKAGGAPWYHPAYDSITEETPYAFKKVPQLTSPDELPASCKPNRGPEGAPLFLVNHWVTTDPVPLPSNAAKVNAYDPLLKRARECQQIRHHLPNMVAVNFYLEGDLFRVVDTLNGLR
jgi:MFS family permease